MTIKEWLYKHKNVTLLILALITYGNMKAWYESLIELRWGYLAFFTLTSLIAISYTVKWWDEEQ
jgi:hypothetical protein